MDNERNGLPGRRYDETAPAGVTDEVMDRHPAVRDHVLRMFSTGTTGTMAQWSDFVNCLTAALSQPSGKVSDEMVEAAQKSISENPVSHEHPDTIRAALEAALPSGVRVKPLPWDRNHDSSIWTGELIFNFYYVIYDEGDGFRVFRNQLMSEAGEDEIAFASTQDEAKAAAQADYERRILSALTPPDPALEVASGDQMEVVALLDRYRGLKFYSSGHNDIAMCNMWSRDAAAYLAASIRSLEGE